MRENSCIQTKVITEMHIRQGEMQTRQIAMEAQITELTTMLSGLAPHLCCSFTFPLVCLVRTLTNRLVFFLPVFAEY